MLTLNELSVMREFLDRVLSRGVVQTVDDAGAVYVIHLALAREQSFAESMKRLEEQAAAELNQQKRNADMDDLRNRLAEFENAKKEPPPSDTEDKHKGIRDLIRDYEKTHPRIRPIPMPSPDKFYGGDSQKGYPAPDELLYLSGGSDAVELGLLEQNDDGMPGR